MWTCRTEDLPDDGGLRMTLDHGGRPATVEIVIRAWRHDGEFRDRFNDLLAAAPYAAFRWETPSTCAATLSKPFEFAILNSPELERRPDAAAFSEHFPGATDGVATFSNLGHDAILIVPAPMADHRAYGHLASFVRLAPAKQRHRFWQAVGEAMAGRVGQEPVWLNTAGAGVAWLHVRLDDRPKYYRYGPYRRH